MSLLKQAISLVEEPTEFTVSNFERLITLRKKARVYEEAALIGVLVDRFISKAPPDVLSQIMPML